MCQVAAGVAAQGPVTRVVPAGGTVTQEPGAAALAISVAIGPAGISVHLVAAAPLQGPSDSAAPAPASVRHCPLRRNVPSAPAVQCWVATFAQVESTGRVPLAALATGT